MRENFLGYENYFLNHECFVLLSPLKGEVDVEF